MKFSTAENNVINKMQQQALALLHSNDTAKLINLLNTMHPSELVFLLELVEDQDRTALLKTLDNNLLSNLLMWLPAYLIQEAINIKGLENIVEVIKQIKDIDAPYLILKDLEDEEKNEILNKLSVQAKRAVEKKLNYPKDSAGRLMQSYFVTVLESWTVANALQYLEELKKTTYGSNIVNLTEVFIINKQGKACGSVDLYTLITSNKASLVTEIKSPNFKTINTHLDQEEVALIFRSRDFVSAGVVDNNNILVGIITIDDVVDVIYKEVEEDLLLLNGVNKHYNNIYTSLFFKANARLKWLAFNFIEAITLPFIIAMFHTVIVKHVMVTSLIQFVVALGGNVGAQSLSVTIRGLALKIILPANAYKQISKELSIAVINGLILGAIGIVWGVIFGETWMFGVIAFMAVLINVVMGAFFGTVFPIMFKKFGIDPAIASAIFTTTFTDICGYFVVLLIASILLS